MRQSKLFTKTRHEGPKDEVSKNAELLIRGGFIYKEMAGVYAFLPLGLRVMNKIEQIVREEMDVIGGQEIKLTALQSKELWQKTNRWDDALVDNWFKTKLKSDVELGLGFTHEEPLTNLLREYVQSYKDLPFLAYQFQTKFRNEARAKSGILRGREFLMKDMYSFARTEEEHKELYEKIKKAYVNVFRRCGILAKTHFTFASGGVFSKHSHEFQTECEAGEDIVYVNPVDNTATNKEIWDDFEHDQSIKFEERKTVEVGNIFTLGTRFSEPLGLTYKDETGISVPVFMGSYGIGISRLMGTIVEVYGEQDKILWPKEVSPFAVHLIDLSMGDETVKKEVESLYESLKDNALFDDRDLRAGEKFKDSDLIGIPVRIVASKKSFENGGFEVLNKETGETIYLTAEEILKRYG